MNTGETITINGITLAGPAVPRQNELFTGAALEFLAVLHREFAPRLIELGLGSETPRSSSGWQALVQRHLTEPPSSFISPRRLSRSEERILCNGSALSAGIVDFGLHIHRNARRLLWEGRAPFVSLPGTEGEEELQLWQELFVRAEELMDLPEGTIRAIHLRPGEPDMDDDEDGQASSAAVLMTRPGARAKVA
jgi:malate synthase